MVKSLISIAITIALLAGLAVFEGVYVNNQFERFGEELETLVAKVEEETANAEDAKAVQTSWENRKEKLHIWIPHNYISNLDDYMSETVRLVGEKEYSLALAKLEILTHLTECLPDTFRARLENIL
ncbi:MAG: DUF4363 family protein [Clostridia bacterium]|nr:DUF4363 family protein [Clostridia bacterium]